MPKSFSNKEKEIIQKSLLREGKRLFGTYGLKKTGIEDITKAVGIAQGSFYLFFHSKEELFYEIVELEENIIKERLLSELQQLENTTEEHFKKFFTLPFEMLETNPIMTQLYNGNTYEILFRKLPEEKLTGHKNRDYAILLPIIKCWQSKGILSDEEPETVAGLIRSLFLLSLHKKELGENTFENTIKLFVKLINKSGRDGGIK